MNSSPRAINPEPSTPSVAVSRTARPVRTLLGVTGSGKTFSVASIVDRIQRPSLVLAPNKTLAAQLYSEFKELFPENAVGYFVSYYDYYQPEAYVPSTDTYIAKDSAINDQIDRLRHAATHELLTRRDVIIVASVSCIYGIGSPSSYAEMSVSIEVDEEMDRDELLRRLIMMQYVRNDFSTKRGVFGREATWSRSFPPTPTVASCGSSSLATASRC